MDAPDELIEAFTAAVPFALREMAGVEAVARDACPAAGDGRSADLSARPPAPTRRRRWATGPELPGGRRPRRWPGGCSPGRTRAGRGMVRDCMGEVANVVAGQAKALLVGTPSHFTLSTPSRPAAGAAGRDGTGGWVIRFDSDAGEFTVHVCPPA